MSSTQGGPAGEAAQSPEGAQASPGLVEDPTAAGAEAAVIDDPEADARVMELLSEKVPLSLIIDLSAPAGPDSEKILDEEGEPENAWWEPIA